VIYGTGTGDAGWLSACSRPFSAEVNMRQKLVAAAASSAACVLALSSPAAAQFYDEHVLLTDGFVAGDKIDQDLVNAWGIVAGPGTPWWIADNGTGKSTVYNAGTATVVLTVAVPGAAGPADPTGIVFNGGAGFVVTNTGGTSPARFIFASEDGTISAFRGVPVVRKVDNSASGAVYKGLAIDSTTAGTRLYATNFHAGTVDMFDTNFNPVDIPGGFVDSTLPNGYAPFGIQNLNGIIYVTYALQDAARHDDVAGEGHGYVNAFDKDGTFIRRVASKGRLNSPWGLALAPDDFGFFSGDLLVGNFGDGKIDAYTPDSVRGNGEYQQRGQFHSSDGPPLEIKGLWGLGFGNGAAANGPTNTLFFSAGPGGENHGVFGTIVAAPTPGQ
jgi:uncharacterized protein (TIGR03118 family)